MPTITSLAPTYGANGASVTINGSDFLGTTNVTFGGAAASNLSIASDGSSVTVTAPSGSGTVDIAVTNADGTTTSPSAFSYALPPTVAFSFGAATVNVGGSVGGTFNIHNPNAFAIELSTTGFPSIPTGLTVSLGPINNTCGSTLGPNASCTMFENIDADATGTYTYTGTVNFPNGVNSNMTDAVPLTVFGKPAITSISPTSGAGSGGTSVIITGSNFNGATAVTFGATSASGYTVNSDTQITATSPAGSATVDVRVTGPGGTSSAAAADQFTYIPVPGVTSISPNSGPTAGGTTITITGTNFAGVTAVSFGTTATTSFTFNSATSITATAPAGSGTVDVKVTTAGGVSAASSADKFTYVPLPVVSSIVPNSGPLAGGTSVVITGSNLLGATTVKFGSTDAASFTVNSATQITATSPAGTSTVDVAVTTAGGTSATGSGDQFTYFAAPTITGVSPTSGAGGGGTSVTITGTGFTAATAVTFGASAASFTVVNSTTITATSPVGSGTVDIRVTGPGGPSATSAADQFTYIPAPSITSVSPTSGPASGTTSVTITGTNFTGVTAVSFGGTAASFTFNSATSITTTAPAGTGTVDVRVITPGGTSATSSADQFTYVTAPAVTSISPNTGPLGGGTTVTITGTDLGGATAVNFGGTPATITVNSSTSITATAPAGVGTVDVTVTTVGGTSSTSANDHFTYVAAPAVTGISPTSGPASGGTVVTITGTGFTGATAVAFAATPASTFTVNSATSITATAPTGTGTVDVRVTTAGGISSTSGADQFTFIPAPTIGAVSPSNGPLTGGTLVTISGTNFTGVTAVTFGGTAASSFTFNSATSITATSPAGSGTIDVRVTTPGGTSATGAGDHFNYAAPPTVTSITPTSGPLAGGTGVTITGTNFTSAIAVHFGATAASFSFISATSITATAPAGTGILDVTVTTPGGTSATSSADQFTYSAAPTVSSIAPTTGPTTGGTTVVVTGSGFTAATAVSFGATAASTFTVNSDTQITANAPAGSGVVDIRVASPGGTSATSPADQYTYAAVPTITSITPANGPAAGGTVVTIIGTNFSGATAVAFGATSAASFTFNSSTSITAMSPAGTGTVDVKVTTPGGTSPAAAADKFTYFNGLTGSVGTVPSALTVGVPVDFTPVTGSGGVGPYVYSISSVPAGLQFDSGTGRLHGTPTVEAAAQDYTVTVTDSAATQNSINKIINFAVVKQSAELVLQSSTNSPQVGQLVTLTATVTPNAATGDVTFTDGGNTLCTAVQVNNGVATCTVSFAAEGPLNIQASYSGDTTYTANAETMALTVSNQSVSKSEAIGGFISDRANLIVTNLFDMRRDIDRLNSAQVETPASGFAGEQPSLAPKTDLPPMGADAGSARPQTGMIIPSAGLVGSSSGMADLYGLQAMLRNAMQNAGDTGAMDRFDYAGPFNASVDAHDGFAASFHTSLSQIRKFQQQLQQQDAATLGFNTAPSNSYSPLDVWLEGTYAGYGGERSGQFGQFSLGTDYVFNANFMAGIFAQVDSMDQTTGTSVSGTGWMAGPYLTARIQDNLFWNARAAFGTSSNTLDGTDQFGSTRWLADTSLMGRWKLSENLTVTPDLSFTYFTDSTSSYQDDFGVIIPGVQTELGQLTFSPMLSYDISTDSGYWIEPSVTPELIWNFASTNVDGLGALSETANGPTGIRGRVKAGMMLKTPHGTSIAAYGSYDGIGISDFSAIAAQAQVNVPLN